LYRNGRDVARLEPAFPSNAVKLFRLPRYLWREAGGDVWALAASTLVRDSAERFRALARLLWFAGYVRETWFARSSAFDRSASTGISHHA
jgi:hypothetical protein